MQSPHQSWLIHQLRSMVTRLTYKHQRQQALVDIYRTSKSVRVSQSTLIRWLGNLRQSQTRQVQRKINLEWPISTFRSSFSSTSYSLKMIVQSSHKELRVLSLRKSREKWDCRDKALIKADGAIKNEWVGGRCSAETRCDEVLLR